IFRQRLKDARFNPVGLDALRIAVNQQHRFARTLLHIADPYAIGIEEFVLRRLSRDGAGEEEKQESEAAAHASLQWKVRTELRALGECSRSPRGTASGRGSSHPKCLECSRCH